MSRRAVDPIERVFLLWAALTTEEQQRFEDKRAGYLAFAFAGMGATPKPATKRKPKPPVAATE